MAKGRSLSAAHKAKISASLRSRVSSGRASTAGRKLGAKPTVRKAGERAATQVGIRARHWNSGAPAKSVSKVNPRTRYSPSQQNNVLASSRGAGTKSYKNGQEVARRRGTLTPNALPKGSSRKVTRKK